MPPKSTNRAGSSASGASPTLEEFLAQVELKAFLMARTVLRNDADALDAVQDAMMHLVRSYAARPAEEWPPLFYGILRNRIADERRRRNLRDRVFAWLPFLRDESGEQELPPETPSALPEPEHRLELDQAMTALDDAVGQLPERQRQAFMLRSLEGMDVEQTAAVMKCSQGSVKTHYFRALHALRERLKNHV